jgi:hypothetical protein
MTGSEDRGSTALDIYIRAQFAGAAETYASHINMEARLRAVLEAGRADDHDSAAAVES